MQRIQLESNVLFGEGAGLALAKELCYRGFTRPVVLVDAAVRPQQAIFDLLEDLAAQGLAPRLIHDYDASREPTYSCLDEVAARFRKEDFDLLIGIGGGTVLDLAKGVAILRTNPGFGIEYRGVDKVQSAGIPCVLIPTTAGTGSEATRTASFIDEQDQVKLGINGRHVACAIAVLDPVFTQLCPKAVTIASGLDALVHAVEAITTKTSTPTASLLGTEAVRLMFSGLSRSVADPTDLKGRSDALLGSHYAGLAMWNASGGPSSGVSYPLGVHWGVPHGWAGGVLLPHVVELNIGLGYIDGYARIYTALAGDAAIGLDLRSRAQAFLNRLWILYDEVAAPRTLRRFGVHRSDAPKLISLTVAQKKTNLELNPVPFGEVELTALMERVLN